MKKSILSGWMGLVMALQVLMWTMLPGGTATARAAAVASVGCLDFNGDGRADLAIGVPYENVGAQADAGAVNVLYGSASGLTATNPADEIWTLDSQDASGGILGTAAAGDRFGFALATADFDADGFCDLAVSAPYEAVEDSADAGVVHILYGSASGLTTAENQRWHLDTTVAMIGTPGDNDHFGWALAAGDFDGDGHADLAIGIPQKNIHGNANAGAVSVLYGADSGLTSEGNQLWHQNSEGNEDIDGVAEVGDNFGKTLAAGDFNGDGRADLAVGVPLEDVNGQANAGAVNILYGASPNGLGTVGNVLVHQDFQGIQAIQDTAEANDNFGLTLATGHFDDDDYADLVIGVPYEDVNGQANAGAVHILYGSSNGVTTQGAQFVHQGTGGDNIPGAALEGDRFGLALAVGDFTGTDHDDLSVGVPYEDVAGKGNVGAVNVFLGSATGLSGSNAQYWHQDNLLANWSPAHNDDLFGYALAALPFANGSGHYLVVGAPYRAVGATQDAGEIYVLSLNIINPPTFTVWSQETPHVEGVAETDDQFGQTLSAR